MLYSAKYNFIYSKSIKTASTSTEIALEYLIRGKFAPGPTISLLYKDGSRIGYRGNNSKEDPNFNSKNIFCKHHSSLEKIKNLIGEKSFNSAVKISSIRNPYDRAVSAFHHLGKQDLGECIEMKKNSNINVIKDNFTEFMNSNPSAKYNGYKHFFCDSKMVINHFVRMEEIVGDLSSLLKKLDVPGDIHEVIIENIPTLKKTIRSDSAMQLSDYFTHETIEIVNKICSEWFELGGYVRVNSTNELGQNLL